MNPSLRSRSHRRMPKRILIALAMAATALAACNNNNVPTSPTPAPTTSATLAPGNSTAAVYVTVNGSPVPGTPVSLTTPDASGRPGTTPIATQTTGPNGSTTFTSLKSDTNYCFSATTSVSGNAQTFSLCTLYWQLVQLGT